MNQQQNIFPTRFYAELEHELQQINMYWSTYSIDDKNGGFVGRRDFNNQEVLHASKGVILNTRILWSFSAIALYKKDQKTKKLADRAYTYLKTYFKDKKYGGLFWELNATGDPINTRKQVYAQAFAIYACSQYYLLSNHKEARNWAYELFELLELHALDRNFSGYTEAFKEDWSPIEDMRLSDKDKNAAKTMNTHLHTMEAYTLLYSIYPSKKLNNALQKLIKLFLKRFLKKDDHFELFFNEKWETIGSSISFGHDIEAAWLLIEAARATQNSDLIKKTENCAFHIAHTFLKEAYIPGKGILNEWDHKENHLDTDRHWWPQAEAMVGLYYVYKIEPRPEFKETILDLWDFIKSYIIDHKNGEWFFRVDEQNRPYSQENKLGFWKCPYHNSRALILLLNS